MDDVGSTPRVALVTGGSRGIGDIGRLFVGVDEALGPLGLLVNNADIVSPAGPVTSYTVERLDAMLRVNR